MSLIKKIVFIPIKPCNQSFFNGHCTCKSKNCILNFFPKKTCL